MNGKRPFFIILMVVILLLIPLISMQFTNEVNWDLFDFILATVLLFTVGFMCEFVIRKVKKSKFRIILIILLLTIFFLIWVELAVGIFGTPLAVN